MNRTGWMGVSLALLLIAVGCSKTAKKITAVGSYAPVITGLHVSNEPAVRGVNNDLTVLITNVNEIPLAYHWSVSAGTLLDSTAATVTWDAPDSIETVDVYVSVEGTDSNEMYFFREKTFPIYVDNDYVRWTSGDAVRYDEAPPGTQAPDATHPLLYAEFLNQATGQSHVVAISTPLGPTTSMTDGFFAAASPTLRADAAQIAFAGRATSDDGGPSIYMIPATGAADTLNAVPIARYRPSGTDKTTILANPRFARALTMLAYNSDSITAVSRNNNPHIYLKDTGNFALAPDAVVTGTGGLNNTYWTPNWSGNGDSLICETYRSWKSFFEVDLGIYKLSAMPPFEATGSTWLADPDAREVDWSADGQYVTFTRSNPAGDRDIWIVRSDATSPTQAIRVTQGPADDSHPRFSFDGTSIYFISNRADRYGLNGLFDTQRRGSNVWSVSRFDLP